VLPRTEPTGGPPPGGMDGKKVIGSACVTAKGQNARDVVKASAPETAWGTKHVRMTVLYVQPSAAEFVLTEVLGC